MEEPSRREAEVLALVGRHLSNPQIAEQLYISVRTVESHVATLIRKLEVADRRALVAYAAEANRSPKDLHLRRELRAHHNLPGARSSFIGRKAERDQLHDMVLSEALVTLTGTGGCGKTRLALEVAADVSADFDDGVFFVDLSPVSDPTLVGQAVASALKLQLLDPTPEALTDYFASRRTLLLLDNCEHLLDACADLIDALVGERCPRLRILATSREPLGLDVERVVRVPSMEIVEEASVLFIERARGVRPDLRVDSRSETTVAEICRRLDGIPLAIELAATRTAYLSLGDILERLNDRFRLLVGGRQRVQRQQTMAATLDWSYDLLDPEEQLLLRRLAVFRGSFSLRAAEAICHPKAMELLGSLVAKSLVAVIDDGDDVRYRLLESVRAYAEAKLVGSGEAERLRSVHRDWYLEWLESLSSGPVRCVFPILGGSHLAPIVTEADNLTAALEWARQQGRYDLCARIAVRMASYWLALVRLPEMMSWWRDLDAGLPAQDHEHRAMAFLLRGVAAHLALDWEESGAASAQALALADPASWVGIGAQILQATYWAIIDPLRSDRLFEQAFKTDMSIGVAPDPVGYASYYLSRLTRTVSRDEALALLRECQQGLRDSTTPHLMAAAFALYGDIPAALESKSRGEPPTVPMGQFIALLSDAVVASAQGHFDQAGQHLAALTAVVRDCALPRGEAGCLVGFAKIALDRGDYAHSSALLVAVTSTAQAKRAPFRHAMDALVYSHCAGVLRDVLGPETVPPAPAEGRSLSLKEVLDAELIQTSAPDTTTPTN